MEIALLTSSRADFGFFRPLLDAAQKVPGMKLNIIAFGTHLSRKHGYTIDAIKRDGYKVFEKIETVLEGDSPQHIAQTIGEVHVKFSKFWARHTFDLILCLGDRYEMYAAVSASVPFNIPVAHLSGGEETNGAIDNYYRNALTLMATYHFTNTKKNAERVQQILGHKKNVVHTGSLAIENIKNTEVFSAVEFQKQFKFDIRQPFILFTFHPETVDYKKNKIYAQTLGKVLAGTRSNVLVTMPNADTMGDVIRKELIEASNKNEHIHLVESLGSRGYYTALKSCLYVMGNSSSGIVEAASFRKHVINIGNRQGGRERNSNVMDVPVEEKAIYLAMRKVSTLALPKKINIYGDGKTSDRIINLLRKIKQA
ncbi:UDP-N-acetylglucosamine 2-epimerase (hydrolyzing) [Sphingobacteriaceae bacterium]|nr:UDP-N-acetylglucosamine 2-epimerase (hydrolyzing) [Sphingobacteriaceae bacterium]